MDLLNGALSQLMLKSSFPDIDNLDNFKEIPTKINHCLANNEWIELDTMMFLIVKSKFVDNEAVMKQFCSKIIVPAKHWTSLKKGKSANSESIMRVIDMVSYFASKERIVKFLTEHNGITVLVQFFKNQNCTVLGQKFCLRTLVKLIENTDNDFDIAKLMVPAATQFRDLTGRNKVDFDVCMEGVELIHRIISSKGPKDFAPEVFKSGVSSYIVNVFTHCEKFVQEEAFKDLLCTWQSICRTLQAVLQNKSASFKKSHLPTVSKALTKIIKLSAVDLHKDTSDRLYVMEAAILVLLLLIDSDNKESQLSRMKDLGIVKEVANAINVVLKHGEPNKLSYGLVCNGYMIIEFMISVEPSVRPIAPILTTICKSFCNDKTSYSTSSHADVVASFCNKAVKRGSKEDVKYLVKSGLIPLLAKLRDYLTCDGSLIELIEVLYHLILKVPETDDFFYFKIGVYDPLHHIIDPMFFEYSDGHLKMKAITLIYALAAVGISCMCIDETTLKSLDGYFSRHFQEMKSCEIPKNYPGAFIVKKMTKVKSFKSCVLPHIWHLAENGSDELVKELFESLPELEEPIKVKSQEEMKEQVFKHVLVEVKTVFDRKSDYQNSSLIKLIKFLTTIPCSEQDDVVMYHLEDLVSPCLGLLEDQNNKEIIRLVKKFINNLHYS